MFQEKWLFIDFVSLRLAREEASRYKGKVEVLGDYERQISYLQDEIAILKGEKDILRDRWVWP